MEEIKTQRLYAQILYQKSQFMTYLLRRDSRSDLSDKDPFYSWLCTGVCVRERVRARDRDRAVWVTVSLTRAADFLLDLSKRARQKQFSVTENIAL